MIRILRFALAVTALVIASFNMAHAQAGATVTFNDPNCASWGMTQSGSSFTLTCQALVCTVTADKPAPLPTDSPNLTATCTGATVSTTYTWSKFSGPATCPAITGSTATASVAAPGSQQIGCVYKVAAVDPTNGSGSGTITLNFSNTPPASPTGCSVQFTAGSASLPQTGGAVTMVGSCTGNVNGNTTYAWTKSGSAYGSGTTATDTLAANPGTSAISWTYAFQATNAGAATTSTTQVVTVAGSGGGGGQIDMTACTAAGFTGRGLDVAFPVTVGTSISNGALNATPGGTFGNSDALVVRFTTPAAGVNDQTLFQPASNPPAQNTAKVYTLGTQPCLFAQNNVATGPILYAIAGSSPAITINNKACPYSPTSGLCPIFGAWLQPNTTYYITMTNKATFTGGGSCGYASCDMRIDFQP
jgi:hypothetical protein